MTAILAICHPWPIMAADTMAIVDDRCEYGIKKIWAGARCLVGIAGNTGAGQRIGPVLVGKLDALACPVPVNEQVWLAFKAADEDVPHDDDDLAVVIAMHGGVWDVRRNQGVYRTDGISCQGTTLVEDIYRVMLQAWGEGLLVFPHPDSGQEWDGPEIPEVRLAWLAIEYAIHRHINVGGQVVIHELRPT